MDDKKFKMLILGIGGFVIYKLHDIKKEIEYFEFEKGVYNNRKEDRKATKEFFKGSK